jgi:hypothetical protein
MLKRTLILLTLALAQSGCSFEEGVGAYKPVPITEKVREELEGLKRNFLKIEDLKVGDGPLAVWGRKIRANIEVRYVDGTVAYRGPTFTYVGFIGDVFIQEDTRENGGLAIEQSGIWLGLNGMAVGGKRQITIEPKLVYGGLLISGGGREKPVRVRKEKLIVEATLTESCIPILLRVPVLIHYEVWCRRSDETKLNPTLPIWHLY